jgi:hypothetical protein
VSDEAPQLTPDMLARMMQQMQDMQAQMERQAEALQETAAVNQALQARLAEAEGQRAARRRIPTASQLSEDEQWKMAESDGGLLG